MDSQERLAEALLSISRKIVMETGMYLPTQPLDQYAMAAVENLLEKYRTQKEAVALSLRSLPRE